MRTLGGLCFVAVIGFVSFSGCSSTEPGDDCASRKAGAACSNVGLVCGTQSCNIAQCDEGKWCTAILPTAECQGPSAPAGFCPASPPATGAACSAANGTTCAYPCSEGGTLYTACNNGVFCTVSFCGT